MRTKRFQTWDQQSQTERGVGADDINTRTMPVILDASTRRRADAQTVCVTESSCNNVTKGEHHDGTFITVMGKSFYSRVQ